MNEVILKHNLTLRWQSLNVSS